MKDNSSVIKLKSTFKEDIPDAYVKGWVEFYKLKFKLTPDTLIPRPETELLVDHVIARSKATKQSQTILDIGTGSGNIAISLAKNLPKVKIFATDVSEAALDVARENAKKHRVDKRIFFLKSDLLSVIPAKAGIQNKNWIPGQARDDIVVDIIVTNLPYIPTSRLDYLDPSVKDFEPRVALDGGSDGFELYRKLFEQISAKFRMHNPGLESNAQSGIGGLKLIVCEIDYSQGEIAISEAQKYFPDAEVEVKTDLAHKQRILLIKFD